MMTEITCMKEDGVSMNLGALIFRETATNGRQE
jgi:hypothetical protein